MVPKVSAASATLRAPFCFRSPAPAHSGAAALGRRARALRIPPGELGEARRGFARFGEQPFGFLLRLRQDMARPPPGLPPGLRRPRGVGRPCARPPPQYSPPAPPPLALSLLPPGIVARLQPRLRHRVLFGELVGGEHHVLRA